MFHNSTETMNTSRLALVVFTAGLLCAGNAVGQDEQKAESDAVPGFLEDTLAKAEGGDVSAMFLLGNMFLLGKSGIKEAAVKDFALKEAVKWFRKAAELGNADAMTNLGLMYDNGEGVIEDDVEAYAWFNVAAAKGQKMVAEKRDNIKKSMTPEQIAEGQKRSREIMKAIP